MAGAKSILTLLFILAVLALFAYAYSWKEAYSISKNTTVTVHSNLRSTIGGPEKALTLEVPEKIRYGKFKTGNLTVKLSCETETIGGSSGTGVGLMYPNPNIHVIIKLNGKHLTDKWGGRSMQVSVPLKNPGKIEVYLGALGPTATCKVEAHIDAVYKIIP